MVPSVFGLSLESAERTAESCAGVVSREQAVLGLGSPALGGEVVPRGRQLPRLHAPGTAAVPREDSVC